MPTSKRSATSGMPENQTVSPVIQTAPSRWPSHSRTKPTTSPTIGRLSGGPCRQGVAVIRTSVPSAACSVVELQGARPSELPPSRLLAGRGGDHLAGRGQHLAAGVVEVVVVVVVAEQDRVDRRQLGRGQRRVLQLARGGAPAEVVFAARPGRRSGR